MIAGAAIAFSSVFVVSISLLLYCFRSQSAGRAAASELAIEAAPAREVDTAR